MSDPLVIPKMTVIIKISTNELRIKKLHQEIRSSVKIINQDRTHGLTQRFSQKINQSKTFGDS